MIEPLFHDLKFGLRMLRKSPAFTAIAVLTLALGIGANTAIFSVVYGVLLRPYAFRDTDRLVLVWHTPPQSSFPGMKTFAVAPGNYFDWKAQNHSFEEMSISAFTRANLTGSGEPEVLNGQAVSPEFFHLLGVSPELGRTFAPGEDQPGHDNVVVLSHALWKSHFGGDPQVVGKTINLNEIPTTIIGVMRADSTIPGYARFWKPLTFTPETRNVRGEHHFLAMARLKPGVSLSEAQAEMDSISRNLEAAYPVDNKGWGAKVVSFQEANTGDIKPALLVLLGAVGFVLLIACSNVANLMLAKVLDRRGEIAIRSALGASRTRVLRQILAETVLLAIIGGILGVIFAWTGVSLLVTHLSSHLPRASGIEVERWVLAFTVLVSILAGFVTGFAPAWRLSRVNVNDALKHVGRGADTGGRGTRSVLVVVEVALALVLLAGAGLLMRTLWNLQSVNPGFDPHNLLTASVSLSDKKFVTPEQSMAFCRQLLEKLRAIPGVESAALVDDLPLGGGSQQPVGLEGHPVVPMAEQPEVRVRRISDGYFHTMHIRLLRGRTFADSDTADRPRVTIISNSMAQKYWPNQDVLGKHVTLTFSQGGPREIVGIVDDVKVEGLDVKEDLPTLYSPYSQLDLPDPHFGKFRAPSASLVLRTSGAPENFATVMAAAVHEVDADTPVTDVVSMDRYMADTLEPQRFNMLLLGIFAAIALLLATLGIYSVLAYSVRRRTAEIGVRIALGAQQSNVLRLVVSEGMVLVLIGIVCGLAGTFALSRLLRSMLFGVGANDLATFLSVAGLLLFVALAACCFPARRAMRIDPMVALRDE